MYITDFEYDGTFLSSFGCIPGGAVTSFGETYPMGSTLTLNTVKVNNIDYMIAAQYDEVLQIQFDIIKNPCMKNSSVHNGSYFSSTEMYQIMTWLNKRQFKRLKPVFNDANFDDICFYGTFTSIDAIRIGGNVVGFACVFTTNAPWGFGEQESEQKYVAWSTKYEGGQGFDIDNDSQEVGWLYFDTFTFKAQFPLNEIKITNNMDYEESGHIRETIIQNYSEDETIIMDCKHKVITSSNPSVHPTLYKDFNYNFPRLIRDYNDSGGTTNHFHITAYREGWPAIFIEAHINYSFSPIRKAGILL